MLQAFEELHAIQLRSLSEKELVLPRYEEFSFVARPPFPGWETTPPEDRMPFFIDHSIDLDSLLTRPPVPNKTEGIVYLRFQADREGIAHYGIGCDWWFQVYVNGIFCASTFGEGNGSSTFDAQNHPFFFPVQKGENLMAIHLRRGTSSWMFVPGPVPFSRPEAPTLEGGPWFFFPNPGEITIAFTTSGEFGAGIELRQAGQTEWKLLWDAENCRIRKREFHRITLSNLLPGATYEAQFCILPPPAYAKTPLGSPFSFTTPDDSSQNLSVFLTADLQFNLDQQQLYLKNMLRAAKAEECQFFLLDGDVNSAFQPREICRGPLNQLEKCGGQQKYFVYLRGNHELRGAEAEKFPQYFSFPDGRTYGLCRLGAIAFLFLDSWEDKPAATPGHPYCKWNLDEEFEKQENLWFQKILQDPRWLHASLRFVICHEAPFSHYDPWKTIGKRLRSMTDNAFSGPHPPVFLNGWFAGHVHEYLRSMPYSDILAATAPPRTPLTDGKNYGYPVFTVAGPHGTDPLNPFSNRCTAHASCFRLDCTPNGFTVRSWNQDGTLLEHLQYDRHGNCTEIQTCPHFAAPAFSPHPSAATCPGDPLA